MLFIELNISELTLCSIETFKLIYSFCLSNRIDYEAETRLRDVNFRSHFHFKTNFRRQFQLVRPDFWNLFGGQSQVDPVEIGQNWRRIPMRSWIEFRSPDSWKTPPSCAERGVYWSRGRFSGDEAAVANGSADRSFGVRWKRLFLASDSDDPVSGPSERFHILKLAFKFHLFGKLYTFQLILSLKTAAVRIFSNILPAISWFVLSRVNEVTQQLKRNILWQVSGSV